MGLLERPAIWLMPSWYQPLSLRAGSCSPSYLYNTSYPFHIQIQSLLPSTSHSLCRTTFAKISLNSKSVLCVYCNVSLSLFILGSSCSPNFSSRNNKSKKKLKKETEHCPLRWIICCLNNRNPKGILM
jgi:hypothetical protein